MKRLLLFFTSIVFIWGCSPREDTGQPEAKNKMREAVKEVVTKDFELYKDTKNSLKASEGKHNSELEKAEKELK